MSNPYARQALGHPLGGPLDGDRADERDDGFGARYEPRGQARPAAPSAPAASSTPSAGLNLRGGRDSAGFESFDAFGTDAPPLAGGQRSAKGNDNNGWRRWKMSAFDAPPPPPPAFEAEPDEPAPPPIDFAALDAMREGARKEGYAQGYTQGQTQGYGDGHREGYARGLETARQEAARLQELATTFAGALRHIDDEVGQTLIALALDVARKLVQDTVAHNPAVLLPAVRELLANEPALSGAPCLLLNPDDVELVQTHLAGELEAAGWSVRPDATVARGGCIASAASGELDATLATRWSRVVKALGRNDPWEAPDA
ncbi:flagellar assembly protein FliH [Cupriavidus gilardii]|uniref:flagellar assembly protein FliH n=1 Tax=Cupriavidus gilardii TaxID=82541 RepID=UPI001ABE5F19|nr:flagellar assembly protein FliH [Cupriavidus gilardii]MBO4122577.1 flagellar assembly protein FliH [Cupriavidus gilardii]